MAFGKKSKRSVETILDHEGIDDPLLKAIIQVGQISRSDAMQIPAVNEAVDIISGLFAIIPFKLYEESYDADGRRITKEVNDERVRIINDDTGDTFNGHQLKRALAQDYLLDKGGFAYINREGAKIKGIYHVEPDHITFLANTDPIFKSYSVVVNGISYYDFEFIKLLRNTQNGFYGVPLTEQLSTALQAEYKRLKYDFELAAGGGTRKGFLKSTKHLSEDNIKKLKTAWQNYYEGNTSTVVLNDGIEFQEASNSSRENEIAAKETSFSRIVHDLFHLKNTYVDTIKYAVMPIVDAFVCELNRYFLSESEKKNRYWAADTNELFRGSMKERYEAYKIAIDAHFKTPNEIRYLEDDNPIPGLDFINLGLSAVLLDAKTGDIYTPNTNQTFSASGFAAKEDKQIEGGENNGNES